VALIFWAQRMLNLECDGTYADVLEQALYNGALSGLSRDGVHYFYENVLESDGSNRRWEWHPCPCCTMNVARLLASVGGYFYSTGDREIAVHLYGANRARLTAGGTDVELRQETDYPWSGRVRLAVSPASPTEFTLRLRMPLWARGAELRVNGKAVALASVLERGYATIRRRWSGGDQVELDLPMAIERVYAHPSVEADVGRVCLKRGPLVYCAEHADQPELILSHVRLPRAAAVNAVTRPDLFDGIATLVANAEVADSSDWDGTLYRASAPRRQPVSVTAIPYYLWCNRGPGPMQVWIAEG
jgi:DUF1680 family protein